MNGLLRTRISKGLLVLGLFLLSMKTNGQTSCLVTLQNAVQTTDSTFTYEVWLTNTGLDTLKLRGYAWGINHAVGMGGGGTITHSFISKDPALALIPAVSANYTAASNHLRVTTSNSLITNAVNIGFGVPIRLATMQVKTSATWPLDFNPNLALQVTPVAGLSQCLMTTLVTPVGSAVTTNYVLNGPGNIPSSVTLQVLSGLNSNPCFYLRPTGTLLATKTGGTPPTCFGGTNGTAQLTLSSTGSAAPYGTVGSYSLNGGAAINYTGNPFTINNLGVNTYTIAVKTNYGCTDTIVENIAGPTAPISTSISASACNTYTLPWSTVVNTSGIYSNTYVTVPGGCDSIVTASVTINTATSSSTTISATGSYLWTANSTTYTASGVYTATLLNSNNCDSLLTLNLTIIPSAFALSIVENSPISCFGNNDGEAQATATGTGPFTYSIDGGLFTNNTGIFAGLTPGIHTICATDGVTTVCDTISFTQPQVLSVTLTVDSTVSCLGNDGALTANITGGTTGIQPYVTTWSAGVTPPTIYSTYVTGLAVGSYTVSVEDDNGCFANASIALGLSPVVSLTASATAINCNGGNSVITASASGGLAPITLTIGGSPIAANYAAGTYTILATDAKGCTATSVLSITQPSAITNSVSVTACDTYTWSANATTYTASGVITATVVTGTGCDSVVTLTLTINNSNIHPITSVSACNSYTWPVNGLTYNTSGIKTATFLNTAGCDSSYSIDLTINPTTNTVSTVTANNIYFWPVSGITYTTSGIYTFTTLSGAGCVNTATLNLTINVVAFSISLIEDQPISCNGNHDGVIQAVATGVGPFTYILDGGASVNSTGFFINIGPGTHTVCALAGLSIVCDTITFVQPSPLNMVFTTDSMVSCLGNDGMITVDITGGTANLQPYLTWWYSGTSVPPTWPGPPTLNDLLTNNFATSMMSLTPGPYTVVTEDDRGCFDTTTYVLGVAPPIVPVATFNPILCFGGTTTLNITATGGVSYPPTYASTLTYSVNGSPFTTQTAYTVGTGTYTITAMDYKGCSASTVVTISQPSVPITNTINVTSCDFYTWPITSTTYTNSGVYVGTTLAANGCDSIITMNLTINLSSQHAPQSATACDTYTWPVNGVSYTASGVKTATYTNVSGCDSSYTLNLTINTSAINPTQTATACDTYTWPVNGVSYTTSGVKTATYNNVAGCDSSYTLNLTINTSSFNATQSASACNTYTWPVNSVTYSTSGIKTATFNNTAGCDSSYTLNLTINPNFQKDTIVTVLCSALSYTWPVTGLTYTANGTYTATFLSASGCDSNFSLTLTCVLPVSLLSFDGSKDGSTDLLKWSTSMELNNAYFNLQHSTDASKFNTIAKVNSKAVGGNSHVQLDYTSIHSKPVLGHNYYRLEQVDIDGKATIEAKVVDLIRSSDGTTVMIYPNPTTDLLNIDLFATKKMNTTIKLMDVSGRVVKQILSKSEAGMNHISISMAELASGLYTLQIFENDVPSFTQKIQKGN